jgi:tripartite motif-containing protein 43/48/49/64/77
MNCFNCKFNFDTKIKIPKILINCGHSFCIQCLEKKKQTVEESFVKIKCFICSVETLSETIDNLPVNMAILENREKRDQLRQTMCAVHSKEIEAFCDDDKSMLCVNCIIENTHKNHNFSSIDKVHNPS